MKDIISKINEATTGNDYYIVHCIFQINSFEYSHLYVLDGPISQTEAIDKLDKLFKNATGEKTMAHDKQNFININFGKDNDEFNTEIYCVRHKNFMDKFKFYDRKTKRTGKINGF